MATADSIFYSERKTVRKIALLLTIPCAIFPILMAAGSIMSIPGGSPIFFKHEPAFFGVLYFFYAYGLYLSWQKHRKLLPAAFFLLHLAAIFGFVVFAQAEWLGYTCFLSIMSTSVSNQYFRTGSFECKECSTNSENKGNKVTL